MIKIGDRIHYYNVALKRVYTHVIYRIDFSKNGEIYRYVNQDGHDILPESLFMFYCATEDCPGYLK